MVHRIRIDPYAFLSAAAALLLLPLDWFLSAIAAAAFHELWHFLAIQLTGHKLLGLTVKASGASMAVSEMSRGAEVFCAAAGPVGSLSLLLLGKWVPKLAICGMVQGVFNLLPIYPMDGGRILRSIVSNKVYCCVQQMIVAAAVLAGIFLIKYSVLPLLFLAACLLRLLVRKIPCKDSK